jgi:glycosyltransferase involved in cell wall biosynthesis
VLIQFLHHQRLDDMLTVRLCGYKGGWTLFHGAIKLGTRRCFASHHVHQIRIVMPDHQDKTHLVTIIIPAFNEGQSVGQVVTDVKAACGQTIHEIIVIDDGSTDDTASAVTAAGGRVIRHSHNRGYGASLKTGLRAADSEFVLLMDADGQHRIEDVLKLLSLIDQQDMIIGQRMGLVHSKLWRMPGKWLLTFLANYLTRQSIPDLNSGLRIIRRELALKYIHLCPNGFSFSTTITMTFLYRGYSTMYTPIEVRKRIGKSTVSAKTGFQTIILILRLASLFDPLRVFIPLSIFTAAIGVLWGIPYALIGKGISIGSMLAIMTSVLLFGLGLICDQISQLRLTLFE